MALIKCPECNREISDQASFCPHCGFPLQSTPTVNNTPHHTQQNTELNRDALKIYLKDVLTLEFCKKNATEKLTAYKTRCDLFSAGKALDGYPLALTKDYKIPVFCGIDRLSFRYYYSQGDNKLYLQLRNGIPAREFEVDKADAKYHCIEENPDYFFNKLWNPKADYIKMYVSGIGKRKELASTTKNYFLECYEDFKTEATAKKLYFEKIISNTQAIFKRTNNELTKTEQMLKKEYDLNIIPSQYRNIYAMYYLWDFVQTSSMPLSTAMIHFDLKEIKNRLEQVIDQQSKIIVQQQIAYAQNAEIARQNQEGLERLASIERNTADTAYNTERAEQYSYIAKNNAELCMFLQTVQLLNS